MDITDARLILAGHLARSSQTDGMALAHIHVQHQERLAKSATGFDALSAGMAAGHEAVLKASETPDPISLIKAQMVAAKLERHRRPAKDPAIVAVEQAMQAVARIKRPPVRFPRITGQSYEARRRARLAARTVPGNLQTGDAWLDQPLNRMMVHEWLAADLRLKKVQPTAAAMIAHVSGYGLPSGDAGELVEHFCARMMHHRRQKRA